LERLEKTNNFEVLYIIINLSLYFTLSTILVFIFNCGVQAVVFYKTSCAVCESISRVFEWCLSTRFHGAHAALPHVASNNVSGSHIVSLIRQSHNIENSSVPCTVVAHSRPRGCDATRFQIFVKGTNSRFLVLFFSFRSEMYTRVLRYIHVLYSICK